MMKHKTKKKKFSVWKYAKNYRFKSLFIKNFLSIMLLVVIPLLFVSILAYAYSGRTLEEEVKKANTRSLLKVHGIMDMIQSEINRISVQLSNDSDVLRLVNNVKSEYPDYKDIQMLRGIIKNTTFLSKDYIKAVNIYSHLNRYLLTPDGGGDITKWKNRLWYDSYIKLPHNITRTYILNKVKHNTNKDEYILTYLRKIRKNNVSNGAIIINVSINSIASLISETIEQDSEILFILNSKGQVIFSTEHDWISQNIRNIITTDNIFSEQLHSNIDYNDEAYILTRIQSDINEWIYCSILPKSDFFYKQRRLRELMLVALTILLPLAIFVAFLLSIRVFRPIDEVIEMLENPTEIPGYEDLDSELKLIASNIMRSYDEHQQNETEIKKRINMLNNARVRALQAQINPHFLHNTLQAVNWIIQKETGNEEAQSIMVLEQLATMVRSNMETKKNLVLLKDELEYVEKYINIQKIRYGDKINLLINVPVEYMDAVVLKMSLQPLIENSIYHGLKQNNKNGFIKISAIKHDNNLIISVSDNGVGMSLEDIESINNKLASAETVDDNHIGLNNVNLRLKLVFGPEAKIVLVNSDDGGITTKMIIPIHRIIKKPDKS